MCEGSGTVPLPGAVRFLDRFFAMTAEAGLRVIVTLNDQPDLDSDPLYENPTLAWQQFEYLVGRYANEPAILAWDVRSAGDVDYGANPDSPALFTKERVLAWLRRAVRTVKGLDTNHPVTASWQFAPLDTEPYVDFISVHRPASLDDARDLINEIKANTDKPLLLAGYGVSTYETSEADQSAAVLSYIDLSDREGLLGWLVWQAYDFPVNRICEPMPCRDQDGASLHEGLWQTNNTAKAVVLDVKLHLNKASALGNPMSVVKVTATPTPVVLTPMATRVPTATSTP
jgi:hypothetical protein